MSEERLIANYALCGDPTCESPSCRSSALDAWFERQEREARDIVRAYLGLPHSDGSQEGRTDDQ